MKQILVTIKQVIEVPNSFKIGNYLKNDSSMNLIKVGKKFAAPDISWSSWVDGGSSPNCLISGESDEDLIDKLNNYTEVGYSFEEFPANIEIDLNIT
jgi:hypothetical protein